MRTQVLAWALLAAACSRGPSLNDYAADFSKACEPGPAAHEFLAESDGLPPDIRLARAYTRLDERWTYHPDPPGMDEFTAAEALFVADTLEGDCEDFSAAMASLCEAMELRSRLVLGETEDSGHAWLEVRIGPSDGSEAVIERLSREFGEKAEVVHRERHAWLQMSPAGSLNKYTATHFIGTDGELTRAP